MLCRDPGNQGEHGGEGEQGVGASHDVRGQQDRLYLGLDQSPLVHGRRTLDGRQFEGQDLVQLGSQCGLSQCGLRRWQPQACRWMLLWTKSVWTKTLATSGLQVAVAVVVLMWLAAFMP